MKRSVLAIATMACMFALVVPAHASKKMATVDAWVSGGSGKVGVGVISPSGSWQVLSKTKKAPATLTLDIGAEVMGARSWVEFAGSKGMDGFVVKYLSASGKNITGLVTGHGYRVGGVKKGGTVTIEMVVKLRPWADGTAEFSVLVSTSGGADRVIASLTAT